MMQGDSYSLKIEILNSDNELVTPDDVTDVEIIVGSLRKTYAKKEVAYDDVSKSWVFPLTQEETFRFAPARVKAQVRVAWNNGFVEGTSIGTINVTESISKEVL